MPPVGATVSRETGHGPLCGQSVYGWPLRATGLPEHQGYLDRGYCSVRCAVDFMVSHARVTRVLVSMVSAEERKQQVGG